jgi:hypothetical protein
MLSPHVVMRGNLDFFRRHQSLSSRIESGQDEFIDSADLEGYSLG